MALLAVLLLAGIAVADFRAARALATQPRRALWVSAAALVFLVTYLYSTLFSHLIANVPWDDFIYFMRLPAHAAILLILALCWYLPGRVSRGTLVCLLILGSGYAFLEVGGPLLLPLYADSLSDSVERPPGGEVEVVQSTGWSCGPAALAWALQVKGVSATERQLARLAASTPFHGTGDAGLLRACHRLGRPARILRSLRYEDLQAAAKPCLVTWHLSGMVMHWIVVLKVEPDKVRVGDPMMGQTEYTRAEFERRWMKDALVVK
jgi:hypothetical protein